MSGFNVAERRRLLVVVCGLSFLLALVVLKAARLQLSLGEDLKELAERQYIRDLKFSAPRGNIYDAEKRPLAVSVPVWSIAASPRDIDDARALAARLAPILEVSADRLTRKLEKDRAFVWLKRRVAPEVAERVRALGEPALGLHRESRRFYPNRELAGQVLGLVNIDGEGQSGVERALDEHLAGRSVALPGLRDNDGKKVVLTPGVDLDVLAGDDVFLTIDANLQHVAEDAIERAVIENDAKSGFAIVVEPQTGRVRALANYPRFNPNAPGESPIANRKNHALADVFEPGSTFKIVTFAAALEHGAVRPDERVFCENGRYQIGRFTIRDTHPETWLSARDVFKHSSNIGTLKIALRLGEPAFRKTVGALGFGAATGLGLVEEARGVVSDAARWGDVRLATMSYGHGVSVTGAQLASLVATVANDGVRVPLRIIERVEAPTGEIVLEPAVDTGVVVMSEETARSLAEIMSSVVEEGGTGTKAAIPGIKVAGKTGTAEKVDPVTGRYSKDLHTSSFVGFAPADAPRVAAVVVLDEPSVAHFGGATAGPPWRAIVEAALVDEGVLAAAERIAPPIVASAPVAPAPIDERGSPFLGLTAREALAKASESGVKVRVKGSGVVKRVVATPDGVTLELGMGANAR